MPRSLSKEQRGLLSRITLEARDAAETAARVALENLAVHEKESRAHMSVDQRLLRNRLRARGRALGDRRDPASGAQDIGRLTESVAYEHWHRMLFTRFLAENHLLRTDAANGNVPVTLDDCEELAPELDARDGFELACRFASETLPGIFRPDDPALALRLAPNHEVQLRKLLDGLPAELFRADDALGWTYQFWQARRKDEVNKSGLKIGADELPAVTQLFTEDYMVEFLLHNSLGAWWAGKESGRLAPTTETEEQARQAVSLPPKGGLPGIDWTYLRFIREPEGSLGVSPRNAKTPGRDGPAPFVNPFLDVEVTQNQLPHWQQGEAWIFVTWRLADSLPAEKLKQWQQEKDAWLIQHPEPWDEATTRDYHARFTQRIEDWLDAGHGDCLLRQPELRRIVTDALAFFDTQRYELGDWVVMPNHVHVLFRPLNPHRLADIIHSWKSFTAKEINQRTGRKGALWQEDYWDRLVRNERHLEACRRYIAENPSKAGLPDGWSRGVSPRNSNTPGRDGPAPVAAPFMPAAGVFEGWPLTAAEIRFLDPCMGSGHFLVFALPILARLRMEEEGLDGAQAVAAVLRDNLHGLEIDERCTQIAAFNVALTAWKLGGWQVLPPLHLACSGLAPHAAEKDWIAGAGASRPGTFITGRDGLSPDDRLQRGMGRLYRLFKDAPVLGSLINPRTAGDLLDAEFHELQPLLAEALRAEKVRDDEGREMGVVAQGLAKAAELLAGRFTLVATNVPYLARGKQGEILKQYCERHYPEAKNDIANVFLERCLEWSRGVSPRNSNTPGRDGPAPFDAAPGTVQVVMPQNWLFLGSYRKQRERLLRGAGWNLLGRLGPGAFETISGEVVNAILLTLTNAPAANGFMLSGVDASGPRGVEGKAALLRDGEVARVEQAGQLGNPDGRVAFSNDQGGTLLQQYAAGLNGMHGADSLRFRFCFWEIGRSMDWAWFHGTCETTQAYGGMEHIFFWGKDGNIHRENPQAYVKGESVWGKLGVAVSMMRELPVTLYTGEKFDISCTPIIPHDSRHLPAIWCFCSSPEFHAAVRQIDQSLKVTNATLVKVPFDLEYWQRVAAEKYPDGLPKPHSDDPTQWLFNGHPWSGGVSPPKPGRDGPAPLHVAVARLLGYRWPRQTGSEFPDCPALGPDGLEDHADPDGIVCLPPLNREQPAAARLRALLAAAWSGGVPPPNPGQDAPAPVAAPTEAALLAATGAKSTTLEDWLRDEFFEQHCKLFHQRPFVWHIWDGRKDGFHALVNYHRLDQATLQKLTYSYLGDWIRQQDADAKADKPGAAERLGAARALEAELMNILAGEPPYDLFIRWKPLSEQPLGWNPDPNDGVRLNIRPFLSAKDVGKKGAGILRAKPNIKWDKDRGKEPHRDPAEYPWFWHDAEPLTDCEPSREFTGHRWNNVHFTLARKKAARDKGG